MATPLENQFTEGKVILIDKPHYWTSFNAVSKVKALLRHHLGLKKIKIGHAGTLDPLATGLLIICSGKMTRSIELYQRQEKEYTGTFFIGAATPSCDLETEPGPHLPTSHITPEMVQQAVAQLTGNIMQEPPLFSARKIDGKRAYTHARKGHDLTLPASPVTIYQFEITRWQLPEADFRVVCSKGTYIRSLARDFGLLLQSGAYLQKLRRTRIGQFHVDNSVTPAQFQQYIEQLTAAS